MMNHSILLLAQELPATTERSFHLTPGGWITMTLSVGFVTGLLLWCIYRVMRTPGPGEHLHSQADIGTPDARRDD